MAFETLPVVHLDGGRLPEYPDAEPDAVLTRLARQFGSVVLVDVQGVKRNDADLEFVQAGARRRPLWVDAGSRYATDAMDLFIAGAEAVTLRWNTLAAAKELEEAAEFCQPGSLFLGLEYPNNTFLRNPRDARDAVDVVRLAESLGIGVVFVVERPDAGFLRALPSAQVPRFVQGGTPRLASDAQAMGFQGLILPANELPREDA